MNTRERVARAWHEGSDHAKDGTPFGGPLCNCWQVAGRIMPMLRDAWAAGQETGINDDLGDWEVAPSITHNPYETEEDRHVDQ
mgnify:CR=1 FL=1